MARVLLIFSILIGFGSAFLGFKTKQQAEALQENLKTAKTSLNKANSDLAVSKKELGETKTALDEAKTTLKTKEEELTNAKGQLETTKADLAKSQEAIDEAKKKVASAEAAVEELRKTIPGGVDLATLPQRMAELQKEKEKAVTELAEAKQVQETLKARADDLQATMDSKDRTIKEYKEGYVRNGLSGKVVAYNPGWNFVVLNLGDKAGLKAGVQMVILRGGNMVGKVKVTSVEPNTAIADVLPGTLARGDSVQPGDSVVFEGNRR